MQQAGRFTMIITDPIPASQNQFAVAYRVLSDAIAARAFPGCAFGVFAGGSVLLKGAAGRFTYENEAPEVMPQTVFDVASITKVAATTAIAMLLHQRGQLDLEMPLGELVPGFVVGRPVGDHASKVTLRHLLAHNSGLPGHVEFFRTAATSADLYRACLKLPLEAEPGSRMEYSDPGFILLGKALEVILEECLASFVAREIYVPLGMAETCFCPAADVRLQIPPTEEDRTLRHRIIQGEVQDENAFLLKGAAGHAGLFSNVPDLLRFAKEILEVQKPFHPYAAQPRLFTRDTVEIFSERQGPAGGSRAIGWDTPSANSSSGQHFSPRSIGHLGYSGCSLWLDRDAEIAVVLLTNRTWPERQSQLIREVRPAFHDAIREAL